MAIPEIPGVKFPPMEVALESPVLGKGEVRKIDPDTGAAKGVKLARFDLIPQGPLMDLALHFGKGANKYNRPLLSMREFIVAVGQRCSCGKTTSQPSATLYEDTLRRVCALNATSLNTQKPGTQNVTQTELHTSPDCAECATTEISRHGTQNMLKGSAKNTKSGNLRTNSKLKPSAISMFVSQELKSDTKPVADSLCCPVSGSVGKTNKTCLSCKKEYVLSVESDLKEHLTRTTTTQLGNLEDSCVGDAIKDWASSGIPQKVLSEHSTTCVIHQLFSFNGREWVLSGDRNWERGYAWSSSYAALCRHLSLFWAGQDFDMDAGPMLGQPHITAVAWHAFVLREYMRTHPEKDDRVKSLPPGVPAEDIL